jgi:hypothetical protein
MLDSLQYQVNEFVISDSVNVNFPIEDSSTLSKPIVVNFFQNEGIDISPILHLYNSNTDVIAYVLLILLGIISTIWYFMPDRFSTIFSIRSESNLSRSGNSLTKVHGTLVMGFLWLNFVISTCIFILILLQRFFEKDIVGITDFEILGYIFLLLIGLLLYRFIIIFAAGAIFQTQKLKRLQVIIGLNTNFITGVLLVPITLVVLYTGVNFFIYIGIAVIVILQVYRLLKTVIIGKSSVIFSALHIILYLCTLEIVPVLVLMRLIGNASDI